MRKAASLCVMFLLLTACKAGPPAISEFKIGKTKDVAQPAKDFAAGDTLYGTARIDNPPKDGKVTGRLVIVDVEGQQPGPIPGLETTLDLGGAMNSADFTFTPPTNGWPNGKYQMEVVLVDGTGAEKDKKTADLTTSGNEAAVAEDEAPAEEGAETGTATEDDTTT